MLYPFFTCAELVESDVIGAGLMMTEAKVATVSVEIMTPRDNDTGMSM